STLLYDAPISLNVQSYAPRMNIRSKVNVDGTGIAWWSAGESAPLRYVAAGPPWSEPNLPALAPRLRSGAQLVAVRSATAGIPVSTGHVHPFVQGDIAFAHNGFLGKFRESTRRPLEQRLPDRL